MAYDDDDDDEYVINSYAPSLDKWTTLPPLPVRHFGLGQINGELVAVGGTKKNITARNNLYTLL